MRKISKLGEEKKNSRKTSVRGKQILVGGLVVLVAVAGYYRWTNEDNMTNVAVENAEEETVPVMSTAKSEKESYFTAARKDRDSSRSEAEDKLQEIADDDETTADAKAEARDKLALYADSIKTEGEIESLVKAKGYDDCIAFIDEEEIRIVVKADKLDEDKVSQITNIVTAKTEFKPSQIVISSHE